MLGLPHPLKLKIMEPLNKILEPLLLNPTITAILRVKIIDWSNYRHQNEGLITPELKAAICNQLNTWGKDVNFCFKYNEFYSTYLSEIRNGKKKFITAKFIRLCNVLNIEIEDYVYYNGSILQEP